MMNGRGILTLSLLLSASAVGHAQAGSSTAPAVQNAPPRTGSSPLPVEFMAGNDYGSLNLVLSKPFAAASRWGVFYQSTLVAGFTRDVDDDVAMQSLLYFAPGRGLRITGGAFYGTRPGVTPTAGLQYLKAGPRWFVLVSPRANFDQDVSYSVFSIFRYTSGAPRAARLYTSLQALNTFDANRHIKSYQWARVGVDLHGTQTGLALNFDEAGPSPKVSTSVGVFVRRELF